MINSMWWLKTSQKSDSLETSCPKNKQTVMRYAKAKWEQMRVYHIKNSKRHRNDSRPSSSIKSENDRWIGL